jgi:hypothetical protein
VTEWPFPGDLPVDQSRQVALEYRRALQLVDPAACAAIDAAACWANQGWVIGELAVETEDDLVTVSRAAELVGRSTRWVWDWAHEHPEAVGRRRPIMVKVGHLRAAVAYQRGQRARRG